MISVDSRQLQPNERHESLNNRIIIREICLRARTRHWWINNTVHAFQPLTDDHDAVITKGVEGVEAPTYKLLIRVSFMT